MTDTIGAMDSSEPSSQQSVLDTLKSVEFRLTLRGYHIDDVDDYLDNVEKEVRALKEQARTSADRLRQAAERIAVLEQQLDEARRQPSQPAAVAPSDEALQRTLQMAQRFVEQTRAEALAEAQSTVTEAQERAAGILNEAEDRAHRLSEDAQRQLREDVERLQGVRNQLSHDVESVARHLESERTRLRSALGELSSWVEENLQPASSLLAPRPAEAPTSGTPVNGDIDLPPGAGAGPATSGPGSASLPGLGGEVVSGDASPGADRPSGMAGGLGAHGRLPAGHGPRTFA